LWRSVFELFRLFRVKELAVGVDDRKGWNAFGDRNVVFLRDIDVFVHMAYVDVDENKVLCEELGVRALVVVDVEDLTVAAPVAAKVEDDAFMFAASLREGGGYIGGGVGGFGVEILIGFGDDLR